MLVMKVRNIFTPILFFILSGCAVLSPDNDRDYCGSSGEGNNGSYGGVNAPVSLAVSPGNVPGTLWMAQIMDKYHSAYDVYSDYNSGGNHFVVKAMIGSDLSTNVLNMTEYETNTVYSGDSAIKVTLNPANSQYGSFYSTTMPDGKPNTQVYAVNSQATPHLALLLSTPRYTNSLTFAERNNQVGGYGFDFNTDKDGIWYEGTAAMAMTYLYKGLTAKAASAISTLNAGRAASGAMYAASVDNLSTGYKDVNNQDLIVHKREHSGSTAWKLLLDKRKNPYRLGASYETLSGTPVSGNPAEYTMLTNAMDQYHRAYQVYDDFCSPGNHFNVFARFGSYSSLDAGCTETRQSGDSSIKVETWRDIQDDPTITGWGGGYYLMNGALGADNKPLQNWGTVPDAGVDLSGATELTFWAKGKLGGEKVEFFCAGVGRNPENGNPTSSYPDSSSKISLGTITLTTTWTKYTINLTGKNLSYVLGGFGFYIPKAGNVEESEVIGSFMVWHTTIYIDNIQFNKPRTTEPRFLVSYKTDINNDPLNPNSYDRVMKQVAYSYDNAMALMSLLACGDNARAKVIADAFVHAQTNDRYYNDGRIRNAYTAGDIGTPPGWNPNGKKNVVRIPGWYVETFDMNTYSFINDFYEDKYAVSSSTKSLAYAMLALLAYYQKTGSAGADYLQAVKNMGDWVENSLKDASGGYVTGLIGWEPSPVKETTKSVDDNSVLYAVFSRLYAITADSKWDTRATWAKNFVLSMWNTGAGYYFMNGIMTSATNVPITNWGKTANAGLNLSGATTLSFYARGASGNESVEFFCGGIGRDVNTGAATESYPDSFPKVSTGPIKLTTSWTKYSINLSGKDLSYVLGGFGFYATASGTGLAKFYIDDIKYDKPRLAEPRLLTSFQTKKGTTNAFDVAMKNVAYTYDNAMAILSFLAVGENDRARMVADALIYAQGHDRYYNDGRLRNAYKSGDISAPNGWIIGGKSATALLPGFWDPISNSYREDRFNVSQDTGNQAWAMLAWLACYNILGDSKYLDAAKKLGLWVDGQLKDTRGFGGYMGQFEGWEPAVKRTYKSTEHNLDLYAAYRRLYDITGDSAWLNRALNASNFCINMWDDAKKTFYAGTRDDGVTLAYGKWEEVLPMDAQPWMLLALRLQGTKYTNGLAFNESNCQCPGKWGFDFDNYDPLNPTKPSWKEGIWYEGTGQMATAYMLTGQWQKATNVLNTIKADRSIGGAQYAAGPAGVEQIFTGFYLAEGPWNYYRREHVGATGWSVMVEKGINPFWLGTTGGFITPAAAYNTNTFGFYTETASHKNSGIIPYGNGATMNAWSGTASLSENSSATFEGGLCYKVVINSGSWFGCGVASAAVTNLSAYSNGTLIASFKSANGSTIRIGIESDNGTVQDAWVKLGLYGFTGDGNWKTVKIPVTDFKAANPNLDLTKVKQYFMLSQDGTPTVGHAFYFDDIYLERIY